MLPGLLPGDQVAERVARRFPESGTAGAVFLCDLRFCGGFVKTTLQITFRSGNRFQWADDLSATREPAGCVVFAPQVR